MCSHLPQLFLQMPGTSLRDCAIVYSNNDGYLGYFQFFADIQIAEVNHLVHVHVFFIFLPGYFGRDH